MTADQAGRRPDPDPADPAPGASDDPAPEPGVTPDRGAGPAGGSFGDPRVDGAMARLETSGDRTAAEQVAEYEAAHRVLQDTLATIDEA